MDRLIDEKTKENPDHVKYAEAAIVRDILDARVIWVERFWADYWIFLKNGHVLLGMFFTHRLHPFSRWERFWLLIAQIFFSFFAASMGLLATFDSQCFRDDESATIADCKTGLGSTGLAIVFGILSFIYIKVMTFFAVCACAQNTCCERPCNWIGRYFVVYGLVIGMVLFGLGMGLIAALNSDFPGRGVFGAFVTDFAVAQGMSWVYGIGIGVALFWWSRRGELKTIEKSDFDTAYDYWTDKNYKAGWEGGEKLDAYKARARGAKDAATGKATEMANVAKGKFSGLRGKFRRGDKNEEPPKEDV